MSMCTPQTKCDVLDQQHKFICATHCCPALLLLLPCCHLQALMSEVQSLRQQVQTLADLLHTAVPSLPPSPLSGRHSVSVYSDRDE